jgi:Tol biopolymer transport system component
VTGEAPKFHYIYLAAPDGSGQRQILTHAQWPALSPEGARIAYLGSPEGGSKGLYIANADGSNPTLVVNDSGVCCISWSHDAAWILYAISPRPNQPGGNLFKVKVDGVYKTIVPLGVIGNGPSFSPDSKQIVFSGSLPNQGTLGLVIASADGSGAHQITTDNGGNAQWSPSGNKLVYHADDGASHRQIFVINADGSGKKQLTNGKSNDGQPIWSRDGGLIFWRSDQNGTAWAIYVMNPDGSNQRKLINDVAPDPTFWGWESLSVSQ